MAGRRTYAFWAAWPARGRVWHGVLRRGDALRKRASPRPITTNLLMLVGFTRHAVVSQSPIIANARTTALGLPLPARASRWDIPMRCT